MNKKRFTEKFSENDDGNGSKNKPGNSSICKNTYNMKSLYDFRLWMS